MAELSAYEQTRAERIKANNAYLMSLGLLDDAKAMKKPKPAKVQPKPKAAAKDESGPARTSRRLSGGPAEDIALLDGSEAQVGWQAPERPERDPYCCWWTVSEEKPWGVQRPPLTDEQHRALTTHLSAEQRESLSIDGADEWVTDMLKLSRAYGGKSPEAFCVPSRDNFKKVLDTVAVLASGEGVTCSYRGGTFDAGKRYTPNDDLDEALGRALKWLPKNKDKSNGWTFTHPFEKMKQYQRALFWRHLFPFVWPGAQPSAQAMAAAATLAEASAGAEEAAAWRRMGVAPAEGAAEGAAEDAVVGSDTQQKQVAEPDDDDDDENVPLKRRKATHDAGAPSMASPVAAPPPSAAPRLQSFAYRQAVELWRGDGWVAAVIDNVNEGEGTFDLEFEDGEGEENVAAERIRAQKS